ncbi:phage tail protein [Paracoccus sp. Z118]|uniref:phage tail protein n=1 Tax=Paracoccus sp. Z118 TaxID=2851017 RepID=UPI001C2C597A|nr:phage tail protein [Paracoccus sp. Z118]MBV0891526.1 phage tail protein [Paracoccus sp. Z118]
MAVLAVAGLGAWGSAALGFGWQAGWLVGSTVGSLLLSKTPDQEGPRLSDLTVTSSAYGAPIPIGFGTIRMAGNIIWSAGIREEKSSERVGKGGGQKVTSYSYFASFAIAFAEGEAQDVLRLWADGKLIYDKRGTGASIAKSSFKMRFHPGSETQLPDPLIESVEGAGNVPAHRGLCYLVFEDLALGDFGNRIPNITAEITFAGLSLQPWQGLDQISQDEGGIFGSTYQVDECAIDWTRGVAYVVSSSPSWGIRRVNLRTMKEDRQQFLSDIAAEGPYTGPHALFCGPDGYLYMSIGGASNTVPVIRVEPDSLREVARFGELNYYSLVNTTTSFANVQLMGMITAFGAPGRSDFLLTGSLFSDVGLLAADGMRYVWGAGQKIDETQVAGVAGGASGAGFGEGWVLGSARSGTNHAQMGLYRMRVQPGASYDPALQLTMGVTFEKRASLSPSEIEAGATGFYNPAGRLSYDPTDDSLIFQVRMSNGGSPGNVYAVKWRDGFGILWKTLVPSMPIYTRVPSADRLQGGRWALLISNRVIQLDTTTGALIYDERWPNDISVRGFYYYDSVSDSIVEGSTASGVARLYLNRSGGEGATVGSIVSELCGRAGLVAGDIETAELSDVVPGYVIARPSSVWASIEPLAQAFFFDGVESDDLLKFRKRGRAPVATLDADLLMTLDAESGETWREQRTQDVELPERVNVIHMDSELDYRQGAQQQKRVSMPFQTMSSRNQLAFELPMAITASTAKNIAAKVLYSAWIERSRHEALLPSDYLLLEPTDVVDVTLPGGALLRTRIERLDVGADYSLSIKSVSQEAASYTVDLIADGGSGRPSQVLAGDPFTRLIVPDVPLLRDVDDTGGAGSRVYLMAGGYGDANWPGASVYRSQDMAVWDMTKRLTREIAYGATATALGDPASVFATDEVNALHVFMTTGADRLESVTQEAMLNGANAALVIKANGEPEVIQFREVAPVAGGGFVLRGLLRGRRGTDGFATGHQAGETFVLLDPAAMEGLTVALGDLSVSRYWRAVGSGQLFDDADTLTRTNTGRDLMPYAVAQPRGVVSGGSIVLSWIRRTRIGGELRDGTGTVPLAEASEAYEVDILAGPGGAVLRTLSASSPTVTYSSGDIAADFGAIPATLSVVIYQMSAVIGRGLPRAVTLEIA